MPQSCPAKEFQFDHFWRDAVSDGGFRFSRSQTLKYNPSLQMDQFAERLRIFTARCKLSDDAAGTELMRRLNAQCLEAGMNIDRLYDRCRAQGVPNTHLVPWHYVPFESCVRVNSRLT